VAYETLIDPQSRSLYDWMGPDFNNENKKQVWGSHPPKDGSFYLRHEVTLKEKFS
jgi:DnaJ-class molecular chaperone